MLSAINASPLRRSAATFAMHVDPAFVAAGNVARFFLLVRFVAVLARRLVRVERQPDA